MRGGDFNWDNWAGLPPTELAKQRASTAALLEAPESPIRQLLSGLQGLMLSPCSTGKAASGKDSPRCNFQCLSPHGVLTHVCKAGNKLLSIGFSCTGSCL